MVRLTDCPDMTLNVYRGRKTTTKQQQLSCNNSYFNYHDQAKNLLYLFVIQPMFSLPKQS